MKNNNENSIKNGTKKKIIVAIISVVAVIVVLYLLIFVLENIINLIQNKEEKYEFNFYNVDYTENIFDDEEYVALTKNGYISYCNMDNVTLGIDEDDADSYGKDIVFLVDYIKYMINGDVKNYNACYSDLYYESEKPKDNFTMQKIYDVNIKKISEQTLNDGDGSYTKYVFSLNYKILNNNGTLRDDFLNGSKTQYLYITDRTGELKIDGITVINTLK